MTELNVPSFMSRKPEAPKTLGCKPDGLDIPEFTPVPVKVEQVRPVKPVKADDGRDGSEIILNVFFVIFMIMATIIYNLL